MNVARRAISCDAQRVPFVTPAVLGSRRLQRGGASAMDFVFMLKCSRFPRL
jgi:hypothetical protein